MISLVLPAYNPGPTIERTWRAVRQFLAARAARGDSWEAVIVLDGCTDDTTERLARLRAEGDAAAIRTVNYLPNRGKGYAVRTGLLAARGAIRIFTDVDLAYPFDDVLRVVAAIESGAGVAIGSRAHPDSLMQLPAGLLGYAYRRTVQGRIFAAVARLLLPIANRDTQAGLKGMTATVAESLLPHLNCDGFGFDCELLTACARSGIAVTEVPVNVRYDTAVSTTGAWAGLRMLRELWRIRQSWRTKSVALEVAITTPSPTVPTKRKPAAA